MELIANPARVEETLYRGGEVDHPDCRHVDVDKAWHAIHFLLNDDSWQGVLPLFNVVLGGTRLAKTMVYGPARYLLPVEVSASQVDVAAGLRRPLIAKNASYRAKGENLLPARSV